MALVMSSVVGGLCRPLRTALQLTHKQSFLRRTMSTEMVSTKIVDLSGIRVSCQVEPGPAGASAPPCLMLPGALGTALSDFQGQFGKEAGLNKDGKISCLVSWDPPGYGDSRPPERTWPGVADLTEGPTFYHRDARLADQLMKSLGHENYSVVGWSDGAITALIMAGMFPDRVSRIVSFAGNAYYTQEEVEGLVKLKDVSQWSERMRKPMEDIYGKERFPVLWGEFVDACAAIMEDRSGDICRDSLSKIVCPTLIIHGQKDALVAPEHPTFLKDNIPNSRLEVFPDGKHNLHKKYAKEFNQMVGDFISS